MPLPQEIKLLAEPLNRRFDDSARNPDAIADSITDEECRSTHDSTISCESEICLNCPADPAPPPEEARSIKAVWRCFSPRGC